MAGGYTSIEEDETVEPGNQHSKLLIDYDAVLISVGGWGLFQKALFYGLCLPVLCATALLFTLTVFSAATPDFRCRIPGCDVTNSTYEDATLRHFDKFTAPTDDRCYHYRFTGSPNSSSSSNSNDQCDVSDFVAGDLVECKEWIFDQSVYSTTFMSEANIVCNQSWKGPFAQSIFFVGVLVASLISGLLSDKFGRRHVTMICILLLNISAVAMIFVTSYEFYILFLFILGGAQAGLFLVAFILASEVVGAEKRVFCGIVLEIIFNVGEILAPVLAFWLRDWRMVIVAATVPTVFFLLYWPILPESIRWQLSQERYSEAQRTTNRISYWNGTNLVDIKTYCIAPESRSGSSCNETMLDLMKDRTLFWRLANQCFTWLVIVLGYYGLSLTAVSLSGDPYLNFFLVSLVELPGYAIAWIGVEKLGRRQTMVWSLVTAGVSLLAKAAVDFAGKGQQPFFFWFNLVCFMVGKCGVTSAFGGVYIFSSELFPTSIRSAGVGICSTCGRIGAVITPWISDQAKKYPWVVMVIFGGSCVASGLLNLLLPETLGRPLPENLEQIRNLGKDEGAETSEDERRPLIHSSKD